MKKKEVTVTVRVRLPVDEMVMLQTALSNPKFHIEVRMGQRNAEIVKVEDLS